MALQVDWPLRKISEPHESNDVMLLERSGSCVSHSSQGNERLMGLVQSRQEDYATKSRMEKPLVAVELLKEWRSQDPPGRFLVQEPDSHPPLYKDVGDKKARTYISKLLKRAVDEVGAEKEGQSSHGDIDPNQMQQPQHKISRKELDWRSVASKLYEREHHVGELMDAFKRSRQDNQAELVLITGKSGAGKSELAKSIEGHVTEEGGFFLWGKHEQFRRKTKAYAAFFAAFHQFARLLETKGDLKNEVSSRVHASVGSEVGILLEAMPLLAKFLRADQPTESSAIQSGKGSEKSKKRFVVAFRRFVRALLDPQHPIVLHLDDIQWADLGSLDLLHSLASPEFGKRQGLMIVATCRGNEVSLDDPLSVHFRELEQKGTTITTIEVENLKVETITQMIVDAGMPVEQAELLGEIVHTQTKGNAFFSTQYLQNLQDEGLLKREKSDSEWKFDEDALQLSSHSAGYDDQMVRLLAKKMVQLPEEVQDVLKVAACIGSEVREGLLFHACSVASSTVLLALCAAEERGLISYNFDFGWGRWAHDRFQEAAVSLIPVKKQQHFQLEIGRKLRRHLSEEEFSTNLLLIASLLTQGLSLVEDEDEREKMGRLCLAAARKAAKASAFSSAIEYIELGMRLLTSRHWRDQYDLSLLLYYTGCELAYCNGDHGMVECWANEVFKNARSFKDKVPAYTTLILSLDSRWLFAEATNLCMKVLGHCGEPFPRKVGKAGIVLDFWKTRRLLRGKTARDILNLPVMTDPNVLTAMTIIHLLYPIVLLSNFNLSPLTAFRLVRLTLRYGQSPMSSVGFAFYASVLIRLKRVEEGCFYGKLDLQIMEKYPVKEYEGRTVIALWGNVMTETEPLQSCFEPFMSAHHAALSTGDFNSAMVAIFCHGLLSFFLGCEPLANVAESLARTKQLSKDYNHMSMEAMTDPMLQACYNLMGRNENPLVLKGEVMDEDQWKAASPETDQMMSFFLLALKLLLSVYLDLDDETVLKEYRTNNPGVVISYIYKYFTLFQGLAEARKGTPLSRWRARRKLRYLEKAMLRCPENHTNKVFLLKAEIAASLGKDEYALMSYDKAIHYAEKEGFLGEKAMAYEKAARMLLRSGELTEASSYFLKAIAVYSEWGAVVKVVQLQQLMANEKLNAGGTGC